MSIDFAELVGKRLLVDIREYDRGRRLVRDLDFVGVVTAISGTRASVRQDHTGEVVEVEIHPADIQVAKDEAYSLRRNPTVAISRPDFVVDFIRVESVAAPPGQLGIVKPEISSG